MTAHTSPERSLHEAEREGRWSGPLIPRIIACVLVVLGCLPVASLVAGGLPDDRARAQSMAQYIAQWIDWGTSSAICAAVGVVAVIVWRARERDALGSTHTSTPHLATPHSSTLVRARRLRLTEWGVPAAALALYICIARFVFAGRPLLIDELVQVMQARLYAAGQLFAPVERYREFFSVLHVVDTGGKVYSQFPPGGPAMLALGELFGAPWLVGPVCGALCVALFARLIRYTDPTASPRWQLATTALFAVTPFGAFMFASHMNHVTALLFLMVATLAVAHLMARDADAGLGTGAPADSTVRALAPAFLCGLGLGAAATIRPLDAFAFALPAGLWFLWRALKTPARWADALASAAGIAVPFAVMMWVNHRTTGSPLLFGYEVLWGASHGLGFHAAPWGDAHTPARGLALISLYVTRLQTYLFESPFPALLPAVAALWFTRRCSAIDRYLLASSVFLGALYFAYWHDGFFLGPRFVFPWLPVLVLWSARLPRLVRERFGVGMVSVATNAGLVSGFAMAVVFALPVRVAQYRGGLSSMRDDYGALASAVGARNALVFVRESWGAELMARLWALDLSRSAAAALYHDVDACTLDRAIRVLEHSGTRGVVAERVLAPLRADSSVVTGSPFSPDSTERFLRGAQYDATCVARLNEDRAGYALLHPVLLDRRSGNVYARDLGARDTLLMAQYPGRSVYLMRRRLAEAGGALEWLPMSRDSVMAHWRRGAP